MKKKLSEIFNDANMEELDIILKNINEDNISNDIKKSIKEKVLSQTGINKQSKKKTFFSKNKLLAIAACLCIIFVVSTGVFMKTKNDGSIIPPSSSIKFVGNVITGKQEIVYEYSKTDGATNNMNTNNSRMNIHFVIGIVAEVKVLEVTDDRYITPERFAGEANKFIIAKLAVTDLIYGDKLPAEIYLKVPYYTADVFYGFDSFICSFSQIGAENFMVINETKKHVEYFPNMFELAGVNDLGYGSAIAFKNGKVDITFWDNVTYFNETEEILKILDNNEEKDFPVTYGTTITTAKKNIINIIAAGDYDKKLYSKYISLEDVFSNIDEKYIKEYILPKSQNVWKQEFNLYSNEITFTRVVNGFLTEETITILLSQNDKHTIVKSNTTYNENDFESIVDIGYALQELRIFSIQPKHIQIKEGMYCDFIEAKGFYRKVDGKIYGIIRIKWEYHCEDYHSYPLGLMDDTYLVYDETGNGVRLERNNFNKMFGKENGISFKFDYK